MLSKMFVPLRPSTKHNELSQQAPLPRGSQAKEKVVTKINEAEERYMTTLTSKIGQAAAHNEKVGHIAAGARMADVLVYNERKLNFDRSMEDHSTRHEAALKAKARKGTQEVNKVAAAVAALQDAAVVNAKAHEEAMRSASERRAAAIDTIAAKAAAVSDKVGRSAGAFEQECEFRAQRLAEKLERAEAFKAGLHEEEVTKTRAKREGATARLEAQTTAQLAKAVIEGEREVSAAARREEELEKIASKGRLEVNKVEKAHIRLQQESEVKAAKLAERLAAAEARKASVRYPACSRPSKPSTAVVQAPTGPLRKIVFALGATVLARGLVMIGSRLGGLFARGAGLAGLRR